MTFATPAEHAADGGRATDMIEVHGHLTGPAFRQAGELLGEDLGRYKAWCTHYVFGPMTAGRAAAVCAYLQDLGVTHDRETTTRRTADRSR
jgi:hypothetical protein